MEQISPAVAIKLFFSTPDRPVESREILDFKKGVDPIEYREIAGACAAALGKELEPAK